MIKIPSYQLNANYSISRIIKGGWHLAGGHGSIDPGQAIEDMLAFVESGITTFDCADIYSGVEELIGQFLKKYDDRFQSGQLPPVQIHTKYVPDFTKLKELRKEDTEYIIDRSLKRLGVDRLDLVQFHWWDYNIPGYVETALHLKELQRKGKIRHLATTNFDAQHLQEILDAGVSIISNQVQYSILDRRPEQDMNRLCQVNSIHFLCYGVLAGGFLTNRYFRVPEPQEPLENRSLIKYRLIIDEFGGYSLFQNLLKVLDQIANKYQLGIAEIAANYMLQKSHVAALIIGARNRDHLSRLAQIFSFTLDQGDIDQIEAVSAQASGPKGPVYGLERDKSGKHGRIMKYDLNKES